MHKEQLEIVRRIAERGRAYEQSKKEIDGTSLDLWQHLLDELERV